MTSSLRPVAALLLLLSLPAAAFVLGRPRPLPPADFTFVLPKEYGTLDPADASSVSDGWVIQSLFEGLTRIDPETLAAVPAAAEEIRGTDGGTTWTFTLRAEARWSDGAPVVARHFVDGWRRLLDPETGSPNTFLFEAVDAVEAPDPRTFVVRLSRPCAYFPALAAHFSAMPLRRDLVSRHGDSWTDPDHLVTNGPYRVGVRRVRERLRLLRSDTWHGRDGVDLAVVDALAIESKATALGLFLTGAVDWVNAIPAAAVPHLRGRDDLRLGPAFATNFLRFHVRRPPLDDPRVRRALDRAIDRDALCRYVLRRGDAPATSFVPPSLPGYEPAPAEAEDVEAARRLLAEAGFPGGRGLPELELLYVADETARAVAEALVARLRDVLGVRLRAVPQEQKVALDSMRSLKYDVALGTWYGDYPDPATFLDCFRADAGANRTGWSDPRYDALLDRASRMVDLETRAEVLREAEALLLTEGPIAPLTFRGQPNLVAPHVEGFTTNLLDVHPLDRLSIRRGARGE